MLLTEARVHVQRVAEDVGVFDLPRTCVGGLSETLLKGWNELNFKGQGRHLQQPHQGLLEEPRRRYKGQALVGLGWNRLVPGQLVQVLVPSANAQPIVDLMLSAVVRPVFGHDAPA